MRSEAISNSESDVSKSKTRWPTYQPAVLIVIAFATGVLLDRVVSLAWHVSLGGSLFCLLAWLWIWKRDRNTETRMRVSASVVLLIGLMLAGSFWHHGRWNWYGAQEISLFARDVSVPCCVKGTIIFEPRWSVTTNGFGHPDTENSSDGNAESIRTRLAVRIDGIRDGDDWRAATGLADLIVHERMEHVGVGDQVKVFGRLVTCSGPTNPGQFDFQEFYRAESRLAFLHAYQKESVEVIRPSQWIGSHLISSLRKRLNEITWQYVDEAEAPFASAIMLGNREQLSKERKEAFLHTGTVHLLAISGLHVGILAGAFFLFFRLGLLSRKKCLIATILFVAFFAWLVEFRPPVSRAAILVSLFCCGRLIGENSFSFNLLAIAGLIVLLINPSDLFGLGPQLSFLAVASLTFGKDWVFWAPPKDPIQRLIANTRAWHIKKINWAGRQLRTAILVSALIWTVAMPLVAFRFHLLAPVALIVNPLLLVPIAWGLYGGMGVMIFGWFWPTAARCFGWICDRNLAFIEWLIGVAQALPFSHVWTSGPPMWSLAVFYVGLFLFAVFPPTKLKGNWLAALFVVWVVFGWLIPDQVQRSLKNEELTPLVCTFIDVGHGTSVLVQMPNGMSMLYDAGSFGSANYGARNIAGVLWSQRIEHLDAVVVSHADVDHFNALPTLIEQFSIGVVYVSPMMLESDSPAVHHLFESLRDKRIPVKTLVKNDLLKAGRNTKVEVLGPPAAGAGENDNSNSILLAVEHRGSRILLPGDLEQAGMSLLLQQPKLDCDLVMAPHHGSANSQPSEFLQWSTPEYVVISGGSQRITEETVAQFKSEGRQVGQTAKDGATRFSISADGVKFERWNSKPW